MERTDEAADRGQDRTAHREAHKSIRSHKHETKTERYGNTHRQTRGRDGRERGAGVKEAR